MRHASYTIFCGLVIILCASMAPALAAGSKVIAHVNGGGEGTIYDLDWNEFETQYAISGVVNSDGSAHGHVDIVATGPFAEVWGFQPGEHHFHVYGQVTSGSVAPNGTITLRGTVTDAEFDVGVGVIDKETDLDFVVVISPDSDVFTFQWCMLPVFAIEGNIAVH